MVLQITSLYGGPLEFLFMVESVEDPAYHAVSQLLKDYQVCCFLRLSTFKIYFILVFYSLSNYVYQNNLQC